MQYSCCFFPFSAVHREEFLPTGLPNEKEPSAVEGTVYTRVDGVQYSVFYIAEPDIAQCSTVSASSFGISENSEDNYDAFREALAYCRENPPNQIDNNKSAATIHQKQIS